MLLDFGRCFIGLLCENRSRFSLCTPEQSAMCSMHRSGLGAVEMLFHFNLHPLQKEESLEMSRQVGECFGNLKNTWSENYIKKVNEALAF